jgi:hypothetical protein
MGHAADGLSGGCFIENRGQFDAQTWALGWAVEPSVVIRSGVLAVSVRADRAEPIAGGNNAAHSRRPRQSEAARVRFVPERFLRFRGRQRHGTVFRYYRGHDPASWLEDVPAWREIELDAGSSMNVRLLCDQHRLRILADATEGHLARLSLLVEQVDQIELVDAAGQPTEHGAVAIRFTSGNSSGWLPLLESSQSEAVPPSIRRLDTGRYLVCSPFASRPPHPPIAGGDITAAVASYTGDPHWDWISDMVQLPDGTAMVAGGTGDFFHDAVVAHATQSGLVWRTTLGGDLEDVAYGVSVEGDQVAVAGSTDSAIFPVTADALQPTLTAYRNAFASVINSDGTLAYSTFFGGADGETVAHRVDMKSGFVAIAGATNSPVEEHVILVRSPAVVLYSGPPITEGGLLAPNSDPSYPSYNAFVADIKLPAEGARSVLARGAVIGGAHDDQAWGLTRTTSGELCICGWTMSSDFPNTTTRGFDAVFPPLYGLFDSPRAAFVTVLGRSNELVYSTILSGPGGAEAFRVRLDPHGRLAVVGGAGRGFPVTPSAFVLDLLRSGGIPDTDAFLMILDPSEGASDIRFSSYLGATSPAAAYDVSFDEDGIAWIAGYTFHFDTAEEIGPDTLFTRVVIAAVDTSAAGPRALKGSWRYNGTGGEIAHAIDVTRQKLVAGLTYSTDLPAAANAFGGGGSEGFVLWLEGTA